MGEAFVCDWDCLEQWMVLQVLVWKIKRGIQCSMYLAVPECFESFTRALWYLCCVAIEVPHGAIWVEPSDVTEAIRAERSLKKASD